MNFGTRIKARREELGLSQETLAKAIGVTPQTISFYENGKNHPTEKRFEQIARVLETSPEWLFFGVGVQELPQTSSINVPLAGALQAGVWREDMEQEPESFVQFDKPNLPIKNFTAFVICGDSMNEILNDGDRILCAEIHEYIGAGQKLQTGDLVVAQRIENGKYESTLKELEIKDNEFILHPRSTNPKYKDLRFKPDPKFSGHEAGINDGEVRITGIALEFKRSLKRF